MFTNDFLDLSLPINIKEYYMDIQQYLYDKDTGAGKCSFNNTTIANKLGLSVPSVKKYNTYLIQHGFLSEENTGNYDSSGLPVVLKNFDLTALKQVDLWKIVTAQTAINTAEIESLKDRVTELERQNIALQRELSLQRNQTKDSESYIF